MTKNNTGSGNEATITLFMHLIQTMLG